MITSTENPQPEPAAPAPAKSKLWLIIAGSIAILIAFPLTPYLIEKYSLGTSWGAVAEMEVDSAAYKATQQELQKQLTQLDKKLETKIPKNKYLIINSSANEFTLLKNKEILKHDKCSTGSYVLLKNGDQQQWMFKTPKGEFKILGKTTAPVWKKPDWAFVEEGLPVPSANHPSRFEYGVLGDYSLSLGQGYLIHGTLYQRFLGLPVTHGCIRLNDDNLELVFNSLQIGSKVYIY